MSVSNPSICFWKRVISMTGHRKSACFLQLLVFLEIWVIAPFWHWCTQVFPKSCCHHDLKVFWEIGYKSVLLSIIENMKKRWLVYYLSLLFTHLVKGPWKTGGSFGGIYAKESIVVEISKVSQLLEKSLPLCKGGIKCKNKFFNQSVLHPVIF